MLGRPWTRLWVQLGAVVLISILVTGAVAYLLVGARVRSSIHQLLDARLDRAVRVTTDQVTTLSELNRTGAVVLADRPSITRAVAEGDRMLALSVAAAFMANTAVSGPGSGMGRQGLTLYDASGGVMLRTHLPLDRAPGATPPLVRRALDERQPVSGAMVDDRLGLVAAGAAPVLANGRIVGVVLAMSALDHAFAEAVSRTSATRVAVIQGTRTIGLSEPDLSLKPGELLAVRTTANRGDSGVSTLAVNGQPHLARAIAIGTPDEGTIGTVLLGVPTAIAESEVWHAQRGALLGITAGLAVGMTLATGLVLLLMHPLRSLTAAARRIQQNDLDAPIRASGPREFQTLATVLERARITIRDTRDELSELAQLMRQLAERNSANLTEATQELSVLHAVVSHLSGPTHGGLPAAMDELTRLTWVDGALVALADANGTLRLAAESNVPLTAIEEVLDLLKGTGEGGSARTGLSLNASDSVVGHRLAENGIVGLAAVPLDASDDIAGVLAVTTLHPVPLSDERALLLRSIAHEVASTVERADLAGEMEQNRMLAGAVLRDISEGVIVFDEDGRCRVCNPSAGMLLGVEPEHVLGATASTWLPLGDDLLDVFEQRVRRGEASTVPFYAELRGRPLAITVGAFREPGTIRPGMVLLLRDLAEQAEAERIKQDFVSMVGHELRTPLTMIQSSVDLLDDASIGALTPTQQRLVDMLHQNSERLLTLINDLLDISALDSGRVTISPQYIDLMEVATEVAEEYRGAAARKQMTLLVEPSDAPVEVWADHNRVRQVLSNLVGNAIKYTPEGGHVVITAHIWDALVAEVSVRDDGVGIPLGEQTQLFERFYRTRAGRRLSGGTGLGLAIARSIVELHGGMIWCESDGEHGSTFTFTLPRHQPDEA